MAIEPPFGSDDDQNDDWPGDWEPAEPPVDD